MNLTFEMLSLIGFWDTSSTGSWLDINGDVYKFGIKPKRELELWGVRL